MKNMKKIVALLVAVLMIVASVSVVIAEDDPAPAYDKPLTVTGLAAADVAHFYKVLEWVGEDEGNVAGWKAVTPFDTILDHDKLELVLTGRKATDADVTAGLAAAKGETIAATGITEELAGELARKASGTGTVVNPASGTATLQNDAAGMWMALITPADANTLYNPVFVSADFDKTTGHEGTIAVTDTYGTDAAAKKSTLTLTKTAENAADYTPDTTAKTTAIGDTVTFTVNTSIPGYGEVYEHPYFSLNDSLTNLALKPTTVTLVAPTGLKKKGAEGVTDAEADYEVVATTTGYTITFSEAYLQTVKSATSVTVTYDAEVTGDAEYAINEEDNDVYIKYSHDPHDNSDYDVKKDTTQHYTFSLDAEGMGNYTGKTGIKTSELVKVGKDAAGNPIVVEGNFKSQITETNTWEGPLEKAVFELYKTDALNFDENDSTKVIGVKDGKSAFQTATTTADGRMNFAGLDAGTYYLKEKSAPAGFVTETSWHKIVIAAETDSVKVTEWWNGTEWVSTKPASGTAKEVTYDTDILKSYTVTVDGVEAAKYTFTNAATANDNEIKWTTIAPTELPHQFENTQGVELPSTGGMGTTILYIGGSILVILAAVLLITKRRMNAED